MKALVTAALIAATPAPALAATYPVSGKWGQSERTDQGAIECHGRRVIAFNGDQRTDNKGGVPAYRNVSVRPEGSGYRIVDEFSNAQVNGGRTTFTLRRIDADHIELVMAPGGTLKLQRCK